MATTTLANAVGGTQPPDDGLRFGIVESEQPVLVNITGGLVPAGVQGSYVPRAGDTVSLIRQDGTWLITGRVGGPSMAYPTGVWVIEDEVAQTNVTALSSAPVAITGASGNISKASGASVLKLDFAMTHFVSASGINVEYSVRFTPSNGGTAVVYAFHNRFWNTTSSHLQVSCHRPLTDLPAGDWAIQFYWGAIVLPSGSMSRDVGDTFTAYLEER